MELLSLQMILQPMIIKSPMLDFQVQVNEIQSLRYLKHHTLDIGQYSRLQMQFSTAFNLCKSTIFFEKKKSLQILFHANIPYISSYRSSTLKYQPWL